MYKKIFLIIIVLLFPIIVNAETCNTDELQIESISIVEKAKHIIEKEKPINNLKKSILNLL